MSELVLRSDHSPEAVLMAERNTILRCRIGSHLYGMATAASDVDEVRVFIPDPAHALGLQHAETIVLQSNPKAKNRPGDTDVTLHDVRKFIALAAKANPTALEVLFALPHVDSEHAWSEGKCLTDNRTLFLSQKIRASFGGYAKDQLDKMVTKRDRLKAIRRKLARMRRSVRPDNTFLGDREHLEGPETGRVYRTFEAGTPVSEVVKTLEAMENEYGGRTASIDEHGYDVKYAMHVLRLLFEGLELLETGTLRFPLDDKKLAILRNVKAGKVPEQGITELATVMLEAMDRAKTSLPKDVDWKAIEVLQTQLILGFWNRQRVKDLMPGWPKPLS